MSVVSSATFFWKGHAFLWDLCCSLIQYDSSRDANENDWPRLSWARDPGLANHGAPTA